MLGYHSVAVVPNVALICRMHHLAYVFIRMGLPTLPVRFPGRHKEPGGTTAPAVTLCAIGEEQNEADFDRRKRTCGARCVRVACLRRTNRLYLYWQPRRFHRADDWRMSDPRLWRAGWEQMRGVIVTIGAASEGDSGD
jgi:hypothetical protein